MKKKVLLIIALTCPLLIIVAGVIKFNFLDLPYQGAPIIYLDTNGDSLTAQFKIDGSIEISSSNFDPVLLESSQSDSGERYSNQEESLVFWRIDNEASLFKDDIIVFKGQQENKSQNVLAGSIWKYTGSLKNDEIHPVMPGTLIILNFDNDRFFGEASCNSFFGSYQLSNENPQGIHFSDIGSSMMLCGNQLMTQEKSFLDTLSKGQSITLEENQLLLHDDKNNSLQFKLFGSSK